MKKELQKSLSKYSAAAAAVVAVGGAANAQVVYTQVNKTLNTTNPVDSIDINQDGIYDAAMVIYDLGSGDAAVIGGPINSQGHAFAGSVPSGYNYPFKLNAGVPVNTQNFLAAEAVGTFTFVVGGVNPYNSFWNGGVTDGYLGVKLKVGANTHYGWVRMDMAANGLQVVIKDMAYNATANGSINTAQGIGIDTYEQVINSLWVSNRKLIVDLKSEFTTGMVSIIDVSGKTVQNVELTSTQQSVDLANYAAGIYVLSLNLDGNTYNKKVVIN